MRISIITENCTINHADIVRDAICSVLGVSRSIAITERASAIDAHYRYVYTCDQVCSNYSVMQIHAQITGCLPESTISTKG